MFSAGSNWTKGTVPLDGEDIYFATSPTNDCVLDGDKILGSISNGSSKNLMVNGKTLTVNGSLSFTGSGKINTSTALSVVKFAVSTNQTIPSAAFVNNTVAGLTIANSSGVALIGDLIVSTDLALTSGVLTVGANTLTISGTLSRTSGGINASNAGATLDFANTSAITLPASVFSTDITNLTISGTGGLTARGDITVNGVLNLAAANPSATKGLLEMVISYGTYPGRTGTSPNYYTAYNSLSSHTLFMGPVATTAGTGDVTGIVKRNYTISANTPYTFGNQFTTISLTAGTAMPSSLSVTITIGTTAIGPINDASDNDIIRDAVRRTYEIIPANNASGNYVTANFHYLESELTSSVTNYTNSEQKLTTMDYDIGPQGFTESDEHGRANYDYTNNYIGLSSVPINYFIYNATTHDWRTIFALRDYGVSYFTWDGSTDTDWNKADNWTVAYAGASVPTETSHVIIPNVATTSNRSPVLPSSATINTLSIENGGVLTMGSNTLILQNSFSGGWEDQNSSGNDPGTSTVIFDVPANPTYPPHTTISGNTRFYNVQLADGVDVTNQAGSTMKIENSITKIETGTGKWYADVFENTVDYNKAGAQTILMTDGTKSYWNLTLSGSGTKTMPATTMSILADFTVDGTTSATAGNILNIDGNVLIGTGTTLGTGTYRHQIKGNLTCDGTLTPGIGSEITMNGSSAQNIQGGTATIALGGLTISNTNGVTLYNHATTAALNISSGAFTVIAGKSVTATGNTTLGSAECLVLKSDENGTASFIDNGTISGSGTAKAERWMTGDLWHLISPTATGQSAADFITNPTNGIASNTNNYGLAPYNESTDNWDYFQVAGIDGDLDTPGKGYQVLRATGVGTGQGNADDNGIVSFTGTLAAGNVSIGITKTVNHFGWNLIGNPYPCGLDVKLFLDANSSLIDQINPSFLAIYIADIENITDYGYTPVNYVASADLKLASGEAFFVKSKNSTGTINFTAAMKTHASSAFKSAVIQNGFNLVAESGGDKMSTTVKYIPQMTAGLDPGWDAGLFYNGEDSPLSLFTRLVGDNGVDFTIQCLPDFDYENLVVPVGIKAKQGATVNFSLANVTVPVGYKVFLEDKVNRKFTRLDEKGSSYSVQINTAGNGTGRFFLHTKQEITGMKDGLSNDIVVIPIPQHSIIRVSGLVNLPAQASVYDMNGRMIAIKNLTGLNENEIPLQGVSNGIYLIKIKSDKETTLSKFSWSL